MRQAQALRQGTLASGRARATETAIRAIRPRRQEIRSARVGTHSDRARQKAHLADNPTCCDGIADHRFRYSPLQSVTALPAFSKASKRRTETGNRRYHPPHVEHTSATRI